MRKRLLAGIALVVATAFVVVPRIPSTTDPSGWQRRPRWFLPFTESVQGRTDAEAAIAAGKPARMTGGLIVMADVDPETGLPCDYQGAFCVPDPTRSAYVRAYNATIDAARAAGRLAGMDFKDRFVTATAARARLDAAGRTIAAGDPGLVSSDERWHVRIDKPDHDDPDLAHALVAQTPDGIRHDLNWFDAPVRVAFADGPAPTLLVRDDDLGWIYVYDLDHGFLLQRLEL